MFAEGRPRVLVPQPFRLRSEEPEASGLSAAAAAATDTSAASSSPLLTPPLATARWSCCRGSGGSGAEPAGPSIAAVEAAGVLTRGGSGGMQMLRSGCCTSTSGQPDSVGASPPAAATSLQYLAYAYRAICRAGGGSARRWARWGINGVLLAPC